MIPLGFIRSSLLVPKKLLLTPSNGYLNGCAAFGGGDATVAFFAGFLQIPASYIPTADNYIFSFYDGGNLGAIFANYAGNTIDFEIRGNSGPMAVGSIPVTWASQDKFYFMFRHYSAFGGSTSVAYYKKNTDAITQFLGTPTFGSNYIRVNTNNVIGAYYTGSSSAHINLGALWGGLNLAYNAGSSNVFEDFFGVGSASSGNAATPQFITSTGAFVGPNTSTSYAQPPGCLHWNSVAGGSVLANVGSRGGTFVLNGSAIPTADW